MGRRGAINVAVCIAFGITVDLSEYVSVCIAEHLAFSKSQLIAISIAVCVAFGITVELSEYVSFSIAEHFSVCKPEYVSYGIAVCVAFGIAVDLSEYVPFGIAERLAFGKPVCESVHKSEHIAFVESKHVADRLAEFVTNGIVPVANRACQWSSTAAL